MPDYAAELPLWGVDWQDLALPPSLLDRLADWQQVFDLRYQPGEWDSDEARESWAATAESLIRDLEEHLPEGTRLEVDLWPLEADDEVRCSTPMASIRLAMLFAGSVACIELLRRFRHAVALRGR